jgi:hypothetical protein
MIPFVLSAALALSGAAFAQSGGSGGSGGSSGSGSEGVGQGSGQPRTPLPGNVPGSGTETQPRAGSATTGPSGSSGGNMPGRQGQQGSSMTTPPERMGSGTADLGELEPTAREQVRQRMAAGQQNEREVRQTILLNELQAREPARRITDVDWQGGTIRYEANDGTSRTARFDTRTLRMTN